MDQVDLELAGKVRLGGCQHCEGRLHRADYPRKPRGRPRQDWEQEQDCCRISFCCDQDDCRKRHTPPSVRFLGRRVYRGVVVVLVSAMRDGLKPRRLAALRESLGVDRRTVERWRQWWLGAFAESPFWKAARARLAIPITSETLPGALCDLFGIERRDRLLALLRFLSPITTGSIPLEWSI